MDIKDKNLNQQKKRKRIFKGMSYDNLKYNVSALKNEQTFFHV